MYDAHESRTSWRQDPAPQCHETLCYPCKYPVQIPGMRQQLGNSSTLAEVGEFGLLQTGNYCSDSLPLLGSKSHQIPSLSILLQTPAPVLGGFIFLFITRDHIHSTAGIGLVWYRN